MTSGEIWGTGSARGRQRIAEWKKWMRRVKRRWKDFGVGGRKTLRERVEKFCGKKITEASFKSYLDRRPPKDFTIFLDALAAVFHELKPETSKSDWLRWIRTDSESATKEQLLEVPESIRPSYRGNPRVAHPDVLAPSLEVRELQKKAASDRYTYAIGSIVEIRRSPKIIVGRTAGWSAANVRLYLESAPFKSPFPPTRVSGSDRKKYCLSIDPFGTSAYGNYLELSFRTTRYSTVVAALERISDKNIRHKYFSLDPSKSKIPNSFCFHYVAVTSDHYLLGMIRMQKNPTPNYEPGKLSISGEEQLRESDFTEEGSAEHWLARTITTELFRFTSDVADQDFARVKRYVDLERCHFWSVFAEEKIGNFGVTGIIRLKITLSEYRDILAIMSSDPTAHEYEGNRCAVREDDALRLFTDKKLSALHFPTNSPREFGLADLHASTCYRLLLYFSLLGKLAQPGR